MKQKPNKLTLLVIVLALASINLSGCSKKKRHNPVMPVEAKGKASKESFSHFEKHTKIRAAIDAQDFETAKALALKSINEAPNDARAHFLLGRAFMGLRKLESARKSFSNAVSLAPNDKNYKRELNECISAMLDLAMQKDLPEDAVKLGKKLLEAGYETEAASARLADAYIAISNNFLRENNEAEAEATLKRAINDMPTEVKLRIGLGELLMNSDRLIESERVLGNTVKNHPKNANALTAYARVLYKMGEINRASNAAMQALRLEPANPEVQELKSALYNGETAQETTTTAFESASNEELIEQLALAERTSSLAAQKQILELLVKRLPNEFDYLLKLSLINEKTGNCSEALSYAESYLQSCPQSMQGKLQLARCLYQTGDVKKAAEIIAEIEPDYPDRLEIANEQGQILARTGKFEEAKALWLKLLEQSPNYAPALFNCAQIEMESANYQQAQQYFEKALLQEPFNTKFRYFAGLNLLQSGLKDDAHSMWAASKGYLSSDDPYAARILKALGEDMQRQDTANNAQKANLTPPVILIPSQQSLQADAEKVVPINIIEEKPINQSYEQALEYARGGQYNEAEALFRELITKNPSDFNSLMNLGKVYTATRNNEKACVFFLKAMQLDQQNIYALRALANAYSAVGMHSLASQITNQVKNLRPDAAEGFPAYAQANPKNNPRSYIPLAEAFLAENMPAQAEAIVKEGFEQQPDSVSLFMAQGDIYRQRGQYDFALDSYNTAIMKDSQNPLPYIKAADLYAALDNKKQAAKEYQRALKTGFIDADRMIEISDKLSQIGKEADAKRVLAQLKTMNLNQSQLKKLNERTGITMAADAKEEQNELTQSSNN